MSICIIVRKGQNSKIGLTDFVKVMAQPAWVWKDGKKLNHLYSFSVKAKEELLHLFNNGNVTNSFNYDNIATCAGNSQNISSYCDLSRTLPTLDVTLKLMSLAKHPGLINNHFETKLR